MSTIAKTATIADLERFPGKAELIDGRIVELMPTGRRPSRVASLLFCALNEYATQHDKGEAYADNTGFRVRRLSSGRESFSPDAAYYNGPLPKNDMKFLPGPPTLAVEVRSESDYTAVAELEMAGKRADYFEAGTLVVWDVDVQENCINVYRASQPETPSTFEMGDMVDAEPAMPGWKVAVKSILG